MLKGDMVEFTAPEIFSDAKLRYKNPGIIVDIFQKEVFTGQITSQAKVYWNDGKFSVEHFCYLKKISFDSLEML